MLGWSPGCQNCCMKMKLKCSVFFHFQANKMPIFECVTIIWIYQRTTLSFAWISRNFRLAKTCMCELTCFLVRVLPVLSLIYRAINSFRPAVNKKFCLLEDRIQTDNCLHWIILFINIDGTNGFFKLNIYRRTNIPTTYLLTMKINILNKKLIQCQIMHV